MSITSDSSLIEDISTNANTAISSDILSDSPFEQLSECDNKALDKELTEQTNYEMEQVRNACSCKDNIIKILQEQLYTLHRKHKETIDEIESIKFKYDNAKSELESVKKILDQYKSEIKKYENERKSTTTDKNSEDEALADPNLQGIAHKIANVQDKVKAVKQIVSDSDMSQNVQDDIDQVDSAYQDLLKKQYDRIEDILMAHSSKLDAIKAKLCGDGGETYTRMESKIKFSLPSFRSTLDLNGEYEPSKTGVNRSNFDLAKINLVATLRQTNGILEKEIDDLRSQLRHLKLSLRIGAEQFVEKIIETAKFKLESTEISEHDQDGFLYNQNEQDGEESRQSDGSTNNQVHIVVNDQNNPKTTDHDVLLTDQELTTMEVIIGDLKEEIADLNETLILREATIADLDAEVETLNNKLKQMNSEYDNKAQQFKEVVDSNLRLSSERLGNLKEQIDRISVQKQDTEVILQKIVREKESLSRNMDVMSNTLQQYKNELEVKQSECVKYKEHVERLEMQVRDFDRQMLEKDLQHESQIAKNKNIISDIEGKYRNSRDEMERLKQTGQKLIALKGQNEKLVEEVEQLSIDLEKFKGFESKDQMEMDFQMQKLQCFCRKLEDKLENTRAEITHQDSRRETEIKNHCNEKALLETQATLLREELFKAQGSSQSLLSDIDNYKSVIKDLSNNILDMTRELDTCRRENPHRCEDMMVQENERLKEEMRERNCEIANLRTSLDDYNYYATVSTVGGHSCKNVTCATNRTQTPLYQDACAMKQLRKLTDDVRNTQSKIANIVNSNREYGCNKNHNSSGQSQQYSYPGQCQQRESCRQATVNKLSALKNRVDNMNQKEEELQHLLNALQLQSNKLIDFNNKRQLNDADIENSKDDVEAVIRNYQLTQNESSRRCEVSGNTCHSKGGISPSKSEPQSKSHQKTKDTIKSPAPPSISNDPLFHNYQNQLDEAVTKYKHVEHADQIGELSDDRKTIEFNEQKQDNYGRSTGDIDDEDEEEFNDEPDYMPEPLEWYDSVKRSSVVAKHDSITTLRMQIEKRKSFGVTPPPISYNFPVIDSEHRSTRVSIKIFDDKVLKDYDYSFNPLSKPVPVSIYTDQLKIGRFEPLHFNAFYSKVPSMMSAHRHSHRLLVLVEYRMGSPVLNGGPLEGPYRFWHMYFRWGNDDSCGSEHTINDKWFIMELHVVHIKENLSVEQAMEEPDGFVVLVYLFTYSPSNDDNIAITSVIENFQRFDLRPDDDDLEFQSYFPLDLLIRPFNSEYVTYRGAISDETGNITENTIWIVAPFTNKLSHTQMMAIRDVKSQVYCNSGRLPQHITDRTVVLAEALVDESDGMNSIASQNIFTQI